MAQAPERFCIPTLFQLVASGLPMAWMLPFLFRGRLAGRSLRQGGHAMIDWILPCALLAIVGLHWLFEILPGREPTMWCSELSLEPVRTSQDERTRR